MLNASEIIAEAETRTGIADPETALRPNLERLVGSLNQDAHLLPAAEAMAKLSLVSRTADRLQGLKWLRDYPEIGEAAVAAPLFLAGLPRSGTTFFQYLFDRDPRFRLIRTWEAVAPDPPPSFDAASAAARKAEETERRNALRPRVENFEALHLVDRDGPEECHAFLEQSYAAAGFNNLFRAPGYFDFLFDRLDFEAAYRVHKRQLQLLQWRAPARRWALKYPNHVLAMEAILDVHPDARFVLTHRDPVQILASISNMTLRLRQARYGASVDAHQVGRDMLPFVQRHIERIEDFASGPHAGKAVHVDYYRLLDDPSAAVGDALAELGVSFPETVRASIADWHRANPKNARGANFYALQQFGLHADAVAELFGDYMARFAIPREQEALARLARNRRSDAP